MAYTKREKVGIGTRMQPKYNVAVTEHAHRVTIYVDAATHNGLREYCRMHYTTPGRILAIVLPMLENGEIKLPAKAAAYTRQEPRLIGLEELKARMEAMEQACAGKAQARKAGRK